jgi:hypothetical protein
MILHATCNELRNLLFIGGDLVLQYLHPRIVSTLHFTLPTLKSTGIIRSILVASTERPRFTLVHKQLVRLF